MRHFTILPDKDFDENGSFEFLDEGVLGILGPRRASRLRRTVEVRERS
jgi:hypothetical protein